MTVTHLVTHSGGFHADELLSSVILTRLFPDAELIRSRDKAWSTPAEGRIIYDVGGDFDAAAQIFDHHQRPNPLREDGQPYSSFGLIWAQYGRDYLRAMDVPKKDVEAIHDAFDRGFVLPVDLVDNGAGNTSEAVPIFSGMTLPVLLESLKTVFDDREEGALEAIESEEGLALTQNDNVIPLRQAAPRPNLEEVSTPGRVGARIDPHRTSLLNLGLRSIHGRLLSCPSGCRAIPTGGPRPPRSPVSSITSTEKLGCTGGDWAGRAWPDCFLARWLIGWLLISGN